jgi:thiamine-phosphate pyrophosphorylase
MAAKHPLPLLWLISDARNDAGLEAALARIPRGSGLIYRHYHLPMPQRRARFAVLARAARAKGHYVVLAGSMAQAKAWGADGAYGAARVIRRGGRGLRLATVHGLREMRQARRCDAVLLSPVFPTRSHPDGNTLGALRFRLMAARACVPVIALGGMDKARARALHWPRWAAIDGLVQGLTPPLSPSALPRHS